MKDNGPETESLKLSRLPKWAQKKIAQMKQYEILLRRKIADLEASQEKRKSYHEHTISTSEYDGVTHTKRYFVASDIDIELDNGLTVNLSPRDGQVRVFCGVNRAARKEDDHFLDTVIIPQAGNAFNICIAKIKEK